MSISLSLVAVFIPLLLMSGIVGRLFREFAVVVTMTIAISAFVALTLSPMMCALFLRDERHAKHGRFYLAIEKVFEKTLELYKRGLDIVLNHQRTTLVVFGVTLALSVLLYVLEPKGFFPQQDTGIITGIMDAAQDVSFSEMLWLGHQLTDIVAQDPDVESWGAAVGGGRALNNGPMFIGLKPRNQRSATSDQIIARLRPKLAKVQGATVYLQSAQDITVGGRIARTQYQYTLRDADIEELNVWAPRLLDKLRTLPGLRDVATDQQSTAPCYRWKSIAIRRRASAFNPR